MISVIIPAYNAGAYIEQGIQSILKQTYDGPIEILLIDDGSTDNTAEIAQSFKEVQYYYQENKGDSVARNRGIKMAKGNYITGLDADDWMEPTKLEKQMRFLEENPNADFVYCDLSIYDDHTQIYKPLPAEKFIPKKEDFLASVLFRQIMPSISCIVARREDLIRNNCFFEEGRRYAADYGFSLQLLLSGLQPGYLSESLYIYRRHGENMTNSYIECEQSIAEQILGLGLDTILEIVERTSISGSEKKVLLAKIYLRIGKFKEALEILQETKCLYGSFYKANLHYFLKDYLTAKDFYLKALTEDSSIRAEIFNNLACTHAQLGNIQSAMDNFSQACTLNPHFIDPKINSQKLITEESAQNLHLTFFELRECLQTYASS